MKKIKSSIKLWSCLPFLLLPEAGHSKREWTRREECLEETVSKMAYYPLKICQLIPRIKLNVWKSTQYVMLKQTRLILLGNVTFLAKNPKTALVHIQAAFRLLVPVQIMTHVLWEQRRKSDSEQQGVIITCTKCIKERIKEIRKTV